MPSDNHHISTPKWSTSSTPTIDLYTYAKQSENDPSIVNIDWELYLTNITGSYTGWSQTMDSDMYVEIDGQVVCNSKYNMNCNWTKLLDSGTVKVPRSFKERHAYIGASFNMKNFRWSNVICNSVYTYDAWTAINPAPKLNKVNVSYENGMFRVNWSWNKSPYSNETITGIKIYYVAFKNKADHDLFTRTIDNIKNNGKTITLDKTFSVTTEYVDIEAKSLQKYPYVEFFAEVTYKITHSSTSWTETLASESTPYTRKDSLYVAPNDTNKVWYPAQASYKLDSTWHKCSFWYKDDNNAWHQVTTGGE